MTNSTNKNTSSKAVTKSLKYSVITRFVNFDPLKYAQRVIIVDGKPAIRIKGRVYKMILAKR
jgi:hypothetical protein